MDRNELSKTPVLVTDFDGTMTERDFYRLVQARLVPPETPDYWVDFETGRLTHFEALRRIFTHIRASEADLLDTAHRMNLDPGVHAAVAELQQAGWQIIVASAGCEWYISRLLAEKDVHITVHANPGTLDPEQGLEMHLPVDSPYFSPQTGIDKEAVTRDAVAHHHCVAFAGDGRPDLPAAMLVPPERRFARGWLAEYLTAQQIPYRPFAHWSEIADALVQGEGSC